MRAVLRVRNRGECKHPIKLKVTATLKEASSEESHVKYDKCICKVEVFIRFHDGDSFRLLEKFDKVKVDNSESSL
jgi:hypothetical protein